MSLRIVPSAQHPRHTTAALGAPSAPGVHDTLRSNLNLSTPAPPKAGNSGSNPSSSSSTASTTSSHPLESRLAQWRSTQENVKMELLRRNYGLAEPVKRQMELGIVRGGEWRPAVLGAGGAGSGGVHADILSGRDAEIDWEDVYAGQEMVDVPDFHTEMEARFGMGW